MSKHTFLVLTWSAGVLSVIFSGIDRAVSSGAIKPGDVLPSQEEIADRLGVSLRVVRIASGRLAERVLACLSTGKAQEPLSLEPVYRP